MLNAKKQKLNAKSSGVANDDHPARPDHADHELRQEYGMPWKLIARLTGYEQTAIYGAVYRALARG